MKREWSNGALVRVGFTVAVASIMIIAAGNPPSAVPSCGSQRLLVQINNPEAFNSVSSQVNGSGARISLELRDLGVVVVSGASSALKAALQTNPLIDGVARDGIRTLIRPELKEELFGKPAGAPPRQTRIEIRRSRAHSTALGSEGIKPDPAHSLEGLLWNVDRIGAPDAWYRPIGIGYPSIKVNIFRQMEIVY